MIVVKMDNMDLETPVNVAFVENPEAQTEAIRAGYLMSENPQCEACDGNLGQTGNGYEFKPFWAEEFTNMTFHTECLFDGQSWIVS